MDQETLIYELVKIKKPSESMLVGYQTIRNLVADYIETHDDYLVDNYKDSEFGNKFDVTEAIPLILCSYALFKLL